MGAVDVTALRVEILDQLGAILPVGIAVLFIMVAIQAWKWMRIALEIEGYDEWPDNDDLDDDVFTGDGPNGEQWTQKEWDEYYAATTCESRDDEGCDPRM